MYLGQNNPTDLIEIDHSTNPFVFNTLGTATLTHNALSFRPANDTLYAIESGTNTLLQVNIDGTTTSLGPVAGLPDPPAGNAYFAGAFAADGFMYVGGSLDDTNTVYRIDVDAPSATAVPLSESVNLIDLGWHDGLFYFVDNADDVFKSLDPTTGTITTIGTSAFGTTGAMFSATNGVFGSRNDGSGFYQFDIDTGEPTLISSSPGSSLNDGANCLTSAIEFETDIAVTKTDNSLIYTPGTDVTYDIVASNNGPFGIQNGMVDDPLPAGITTASWTCTGSAGGVCGTAGGTGAINDNPDLPPGGSVTYSFTITVPPDYTGDLVNTVTASLPDGFTDPTPENNTATDTDQRVPSVTLVKISENGVDTFSFTGTNGFDPEDITTTTAGSPATGTTQFLDAPDTETTITESIPSTYELTDISCTGLGTGGTFTTDLGAGTVTLDAAATAADSDIECTFTNDRLNTDLAVTKSASPDPVLSGEVLTYTITAENLGPRDADNSLLTDTPDANLDCSTPSTTVTCTAAGGATCPADPILVADLTGAGVTIPSLPVGSQAEFTLQCTVNATGL
ncbi:DUF6923 family protein [Microbulbifer halophilus]|uniref:DUF6923 family protein n=2 Tax=Microbulbifer halophilus TaxID=453963 RepID=A0ABW5EFD6_9GAMM